MEFKVGRYQLNKKADYSFQLNRLVNMDGAGLKLIQEIEGGSYDQARKE